ncbi:MAG TPA: FtsX-like permease family protein [Dermatophilaceae bacterium]|nr:FtsX-like permease family protein [Dermatophilaceae bacterium]
MLAALAALRYRRAQALVVVVLSALVSACLVLAPLYTRALEQAMVRTMLRDAAAGQAGLHLASSSSTDPSLALSPQALGELVPDAVRGLFGTPVASTSVEVRRLPLLGEPGGRLLARERMCDHVRFTVGRCPSAAGEIAVSADQAAVYAMPVGTTARVGEWDGAVSLPEAAPRTTLRVVGVYEQLGGTYWFGDRLTGQSSKRLGFDTMLTPAQTLTDEVTAPTGGAASWFEPHYALDLPLLAGRVGVDQIGPLGSTVADLVQFPLGAARAASHVAETVTVRTGLVAIAAEVRVGSAQAAVTVPLLMAQLGLLLGCVLWLVLSAAADQRRGEVAVARLRGRGSRGARRQLLGETLPPVVLGAPLGALLAVAASSVARHTVLTSDPPFEVPVAAVVALAGGLGLMVGLAVLSVRRVCREPVAALIRSVPPRRTGVRLGVLEAMLVAAAGAAFVALVTGSVGGPVGQVAPTLLALAVGVVASRVMSWGLASAGRRLLRRGRPTVGTAFLTASRRGTTRWLVPVVTVSLGIVVVTADALAVGARNWAGRAAAEVGAATVLTLDSVDLAAVAQAVHAVDPTGEHLTPVAVLGPAAQGGAATVGVVPDSFRRIALWPGVAVSALAWDRLTAPAVRPLVLTGSRVAFHLEAPAFSVVVPAVRPATNSLVLALRVVRADGTVQPVPLGTLPTASVDADLEAAVNCADGCRVTGIGVLAPPSSAAVTGRLRLSRLSVDGRAVDLGGAGSWRNSTTDDVDVRGTFAAGALEVGYATNGSDRAFLRHASVPDVVPALTTPAATPSAPRATFGGSYVDGSSLLLSSEGGVTFVPGGPASASIVNLDNLLTQQWRGRGSAVLTAYLDTRDPGSIARVTSALSGRGINVVAARHPEAVAAAYRRTAAAWSLQLALAVGVLSLLVAAVGIVVLASTSWRARSRDYAVLRLVGQGPRGLALLAQLETAPVIVSSAVLGAAVGLWAAPPAVAMMPLFTSAPPTFPVDLHIAWGPAVLAGLAALAALGVVGVITSHRVAQRADPQRLREAA